MKLLLAYALINLSPIYLQYQLKPKGYKSIKSCSMKSGKGKTKKEWE